MTGTPSPRTHGLTWTTAGESHGPALCAVLEGLPAGLMIDWDEVRRGMALRWQGKGRGDRAGFEKDALEVLSGMKKGVTLGTPLALLIRNSDSSIDSKPSLDAPRPGHADLAGVLRHKNRDIRAVLERASARETAARTALGEVAKQFLRAFGISVQGRPVSICGVSVEDESQVDHLLATAKKEGDSLGGVFEVSVEGCPPGLGGYAQAVDRLDSRLLGALASIPSVKGVEIGLGFAGETVTGQDYHDAVLPDSDGWAGVARGSNHAGGIEGGLTNGQPILVRALAKPIPTLLKGMPSVKLETGEPTPATYERSDICVIEAASVVGGAVVALEVASALLARLGGVTMAECAARYQDLGASEAISDWPEGWAE